VGVTSNNANAAADAATVQVADEELTTAADSDRRAHSKQRGRHHSVLRSPRGRKEGEREERRREGEREGGRDDQDEAASEKDDVASSGRKMNGG
jgi:hypothetical protein